MSSNPQANDSDDIMYLSSLTSGEPVSELIAELDVREKRKERADRLIEWVFEKHGPKIRRIAHKLIGDRFRGIISADSVVDEALGDLYKGINPKEGGPIERKFHDREQLIGLVITAVKNQVRDRIRREEADKRNPASGAVIEAPASISAPDQPGPHDESKPRRVRLRGEDEGDVLGGGQKQFYAKDRQERDYRPSHPVSSDVQPSSYYDQPPLQLLASWLGPDLLAVANEAYQQTEPEYRPLVDLAMQGNSPKQIAEKLGMTESAVNRRWKIVQEQWVHWLGLTREVGD